MPRRCAAHDRTCTGRPVADGARRAKCILHRRPRASSPTPLNTPSIFNGHPVGERPLQRRTGRLELESRLLRVRARREKPQRAVYRVYAVEVRHRKLRWESTFITSPSVLPPADANDERGPEAALEGDEADRSFSRSLSSASDVEGVLNRHGQRRTGGSMRVLVRFVLRSPPLPGRREVTPPRSSSAIDLLRARSCASTSSSPNPYATATALSSSS
jgi:hypothetical protein